MNLISSIQYLGNKLSGRKSSQSKQKPAPKHAEKKNPANAPHGPDDNRLGQSVDTTA